METGFYLCKRAAGGVNINDDARLLEYSTKRQNHNVIFLIESADFVPLKMGESLLSTGERLTIHQDIVGEGMSKKPLHPFTRFAQTVARQAGHPIAFGMALGFLIAWVIFGPLLNYHPVWLDFFGITTGIFTFLMVFLIQSTQNRDTEALHLKLDELLRVTEGARKDLIDSEDLEEDELDVIKDEYNHLGDVAREEMERRRDSDAKGSD